MNQPAKRPYRRSGLYVSGLTPEEQAAMTSVRESLLADLGGEEHVSTARKILVDLAAGAAVRCMRVNAYLAGLNCLVDRRHRREWPVVEHARRAEAHLQGLLRDIGLDRKAKPVETLEQYLAKKAAADAESL
jgi:hypothetical protein